MPPDVHPKGPQVTNRRSVSGLYNTLQIWLVAKFAPNWGRRSISRLCRSGLKTCLWRVNFHGLHTTPIFGSTFQWQCSNSLVLSIIILQLSSGVIAIFKINSYF